ncbi:MAG: regulatory protein RecX [Euzebya sp.]
MSSPDGATAPPDGTPKALAWLIRSAGKRPISQAEAVQKLRAKDYPEEVVQAAVRRAVRLRVIDDRLFATAWVNDRGVNRGYGRSRLRRELARRQIPPELIDLALQELEQVDEVGQATQLARARAQRMPATLEPHKVAGRLVGFLVRRGFTSDVAHHVARSVTALDRDWD